jgi:hypothetical protein
MKSADQHLDSKVIAVGLRLMTLERILREREEELLEAKGPCSHKLCLLHFAHRGPCNTNAAS